MPKPTASSCVPASPFESAGASLDVYGPPPPTESLDDCFRRFVSPPYFPVGIDDLCAQFREHSCDDALSGADSSRQHNDVHGPCGTLSRPEGQKP
jgi:hypothetical protein